MVTWLGYINLILLAFNLLPALPLDGGRIARAALWRARGDFRSATRTAAGLGRGFGQLMIFGGLLLVLFSGFGGIWLALVGFFLVSAADQEDRAAEARTVLEGLSVADVMIREPVTVGPHLTVRELVDDVFLAHRHASYPVVENGRALGLAAVRRLAALPRSQWETRRVADGMLAVGDVPVLSPDRPLSEALTELAQSQLGRGLVCAGDRLEGMVSITDIARVLEVRSVGRDDHIGAPGEGLVVGGAR